MGERLRDFVEVEWLDSIIAGPWERAEEVLRRATVDAQRHRSIGYLVESNADFILLAGNQSEDGADLGNTVQIPAASVVATHTLVISEPRSDWVPHEITGISPEPPA